MTSKLIYAFFRKANGSCFYVGQTQDIGDRLKGHRHSGFYNDGDHFRAVLEEEIPVEEVAEREAFWMNHFRGLGHILENKVAASSGARRDRGPIYILFADISFHSQRDAAEYLDCSQAAVKLACAGSWNTRNPFSMDTNRLSTEKVWIMDRRSNPEWIPPCEYDI